MKKLLTISDLFDLKNFGLIILPDFPAPKTGWKNRKEKIQVVSGSGDSKEFMADFMLEHRRPLKGPKSLDEVFRVVVVLKETKKEEIDIGSELFASEDLYESLNQNKNHNQPLLDNA